jgi:hypothetical protein
MFGPYCKLDHILINKFCSQTIEVAFMDDEIFT